MRKEADDGYIPNAWVYLRQHDISSEIDVTKIK